MPIVTLRDLYIAELRDLYDAEQQILQELPSMAGRATSSELRKAFEHHLEETQVQIQRLDLVFRQLDLRPGEPCEAIQGLIAEARRITHECERGDVLDAALIGAAQRIEHYEIAAYGCARTYARTLGDEETAKLLNQTLQEEAEADRVLTRLAEREINPAAGDDVLAEDPHRRSRLRYVEAAELPDFKYREFRIVNRAGQDLGSVDGFIVESRSGRPVYVVVDSGGWFVGQRYLVPIGMLTADLRSRMFRTDVDRETIHLYPEFNAAAFLAMTDEEVRHYEHRLLRIIAPDEARTDRVRERAYDELPHYRAPTWLMTGIWITEGSGFAAVPPRAESDFVRPPAREESPENELIAARDQSDRQNEPGTRRESEVRGEAAERPPDSGEVRARDTEQPKTRDPRLERYRER
jgi:ferritin-like metal-binding protein YciE